MHLSFASWRIPEFLNWRSLWSASYSPELYIVNVPAACGFQERDGTFAEYWNEEFKGDSWNLSCSAGTRSKERWKPSTLPGARASRSRLTGSISCCTDRNRLLIRGSEDVRNYYVIAVCNYSYSCACAAEARWCCSSQLLIARSPPGGGWS